MAADTGHGAAITFGTSALVFNWTNIDAGAKNRPAVKTTHLGTTSDEEYMAGDLDENGEMKVGFQWDDLLDEPSTSATAETITLTYSSGATLAGTGLITGVKRPNAQTGQLKMGELTIRWDGGTGPTFTKTV